MKTVFLMAVLVMLSACRQPGPGASLEGNAEQDGGMFAVATLAGFNSFEYKAAPLYTQNAMFRHHAIVGLHRHEITVAQAQAVQDDADGVRKLLDDALVACAQDQETGQCTKNRAMADILLDRAAVALDKAEGK